jgi:hypothetical protein
MPVGLPWFTIDCLDAFASPRPLSFRGRPRTAGPSSLAYSVRAQPRHGQLESAACAEVTRVELQYSSSTRALFD